MKWISTNGWKTIGACSSRTPPTTLLRVIDSLQLTANYKLAKPADWKDGQDCIVVTAVSDEDAARMFPKGVRKVKPYLRYTPSPVALRYRRLPGDRPSLPQRAFDH